MSIISKIRRMNAIYWEPTGDEDKHGDRTFKTPVQISCRYEGSNEEFNLPDGSPAIASAIVYVDAADTTIKMGGYILLGSISSLEDYALHESARPIRMIADTPNLKATETLRILTL